MSGLVRAAVIDRSRDPIEAVRRYLPSNYSASFADGGSTIRIVGRDEAGWTLEYCIGRLASGLIWAREIQPTAAEDAAAAYAR
jgi:hypothetical protein